MADERMPQMGESVVFHDEHAQPHDALVTAVWGLTCVNLLFVSKDENRKDEYGRQIERRSSCVKGGPDYTAHGNYWRYREDAPVPYKAPVAV